jgi:hypothetical protein
MGTDVEPKRKADWDFDKRTSEIDEATRKVTAFVFVTPRRWANGEEWAKAKTEGGQWRAVSVIDADSLETWLEQAPHVHLWLSAVINGKVHGAKVLELEWRDWAGATNPALSSELLLAGREGEAEQIRARLDATASTYAVQSGSIDEAVGFIAASLLDTDPDINRRLSCAIVVTTTEAWDELIAAPRPLILIPRFEDGAIGPAVRAGHHVLVPLGADPQIAAHLIVPELRTEVAAAALERMGIPGENSSDLAAKARRNLLAFRRTLAPYGPLKRPPWAEGATARALVPALLAGGWDQAVQGDREVLSALAIRDYTAVEADLAPLTRTDDPPLRVRGSVWALSNREDAWTQLARFVTDGDWTEFVKQAVVVLSAPDPAWEMAPDKRWLAGIEHKTRPHSAHLRRGIADTVGMLGGWSGLRDLQGGRSGPQVADLIARQVLGPVNADPSGGQWAALGELLPFLAEAAPDIFLAAGYAGASGDESVLGRLIADAEAGGVWGRASHAGLLWGLETLAWSADYLPSVTLLLGRLAAGDTGGRWSNRPGNSLRSIYLPWLPQTSATPEQRLESLDSLRRALPDQAWQLMLSLMPLAQDHTSPNPRPRWRGWAPEGDIKVTIVEHHRNLLEIAKRLVEDGRGNPDRLAQLVDRFHSWPQSLDDEFLQALRELQPNDLEPAPRKRIIQALRKTLGEQKAYPEAGWTASAQRVEPLAAVMEALQPADSVERNAWLFGDNPDLRLVIGSEYQRHDESLAACRKAAAEEVIKDKGPAGIEALVDAATRPGTVGWTIGQLGALVEEQALAWVATGDERRVEAASGYIMGRTRLDGWAWAEATIKRYAAQWDAELTGRMLFAASREPAAWALAEELGTQIEHGYWRSYWGFPEQEHVGQAAAKLLANGRPFAAVDVIGSVRGPESEVAVELTLAALEACATAEAPTSSNDQVMFQHYLTELLPRLQKQGADRSRLARIEWLFLPLLDNPPHRQTLVLHQELASDPAFFVEVVKAVYRAEHQEPPEDLDASRALMAAQAHELLMNWHLPPGVLDGRLDPDVLRGWVKAARQLLEQADRQASGDTQIGHVLRYVPDGEDGLPPHEAVRDLFEDSQNEQMELGYRIETFNSQGATSRGPLDGGGQERQLVERYRTAASTLATKWPRIAAIFRGLADEYEEIARRWDLEAELRADAAD